MERYPRSNKQQKPSLTPALVWHRVSGFLLGIGPKASSGSYRTRGLGTQMRYCMDSISLGLGAARKSCGQCAVG